MQSVIDRDVLTCRELIESGEVVDCRVDARHARGVGSRPRRRSRRGVGVLDPAVGVLDLAIDIVALVAISELVVRAVADAVVVEVVVGHATTLPVDAQQLR